jgi:hypothetical protein
MNEKSFAADPRGFSRITKTPPIIEYETPAGKRRKNAAHGASRGYGPENEQAPEGRKNFTRGLAPWMAVAARSSSSSRESPRQSGMQSGETISEPPALLYVPANTGSTLGLHPANFSRRNERATPCI